MSTNIIGKIFVEQFRVDTFVATGGMGAVYRVWDLKRNVPLAMKVLHAELAEDPTVFKRFQREARALQKLIHPNIVPFYGLYQTLDFAFLMERYIDGPSLKDILRHQQGKPLPIEEALIYLKALGAALGYAHANGVIHCDVKPGNVMIDRGGNIYLTDFGIARHAESTTTTMAGAGTPHYMAPEQIRGDTVTSATDVYALGVVLFEMLTGQRPFRGTEAGTEEGGATVAERVRYAHQHLPPPDPHSVNPEIPEGLAQVVLRALEKEPARRYQSTQEMLAALYSASGIVEETVPERIAPTQLPPEVKPYAAVQAPSVETPSAPQPSIHRFGIRLTGRVGLIFALVVIVAVVLGAVFLSGRKVTTNPPVSVGNVYPAQSTELSLPQALPSPTILIELIEPSSIVTPTNLSIPTKLLTPTPHDEKVNPKDNANIIHIPEGDFLMGSDPNHDPYFWGAESPEHQVYLDGYWIYLTEVTTGMYQVCVQEKACPRPENNRSRSRPEYFGNTLYDDYPVIYVSWQAAQAYCQWAGGRLPTEAEWEKAARGTDGRLFPWGNASLTGNLANFCDTGCPGSDVEYSLADGFRDTAPVDSFPDGSSPYGLLNMAGNVLEWIYDWYQIGYAGTHQTNPMGPSTGSRHPIRGGSWISAREGLRTVARASLKPDTATDTVGFRCIIEDQ